MLLTTRVTTRIVSAMPSTLREELKQNKPFVSVEQEAFLSIVRTSALLMDRVELFLRPYGITLTQYNVLRILRGAASEGLCRNDVTQRMIAKVPDGTRLLDRLESAGLIARARDSDDRRQVTTRITNAGLKLLDELDNPVQELHRKHFSALNKTELRTLVKILGDVRDSV